MQIFDADGTKIGTETQINTTTNAGQRGSRITALEDGSFLVTWGSGQAPAGYPEFAFFDIYARRFDSFGNPLGDEFLVNTTVSGYERAVGVLALANGGFLITWSSNNFNTGVSGQFGQYFDASGTAVGAEFSLTGHALGFEGVAPTLTAMGDGGFLAIYTVGDSYLHNGTEIVAQRFDSAGEKLGDAFLVNTYVPGNQIKPKVTVLKDGSYIITWESEFQDGDNFGIFGQHYKAEFFGTMSDDIITDTYGVGRIIGRAGDDMIYGLAGNDSITGNRGNDTIFGGDGHDKMRGNQGNDILDGGAGNDLYIGGSGADTFVFTTDHGKDRVRDFTFGEDILQLSEAIWGGGLSAAEVVDQYAFTARGHTFFDFGNGNTIKLTGITDLAALVDDMIFV